MSNEIDKELLCQRWVHAHEEDTPTEVVYRPVDHKLPRSRGRTGFELKPDQTAMHLSISPTDSPQETAGSWDIKEGEVPTIQILLDTGETERLPIDSVEKNRLVIRKVNS